MRYPWTTRSGAGSGCTALLALALVVSPHLSLAQPEPGRPPPERLVESWLLRDCELSLADAQESLRKQADAVAELLVVAFRKGPGPALLARAEQAARARFAMRQRVLRDPARLGLPHIDLAHAADLSEADYVAREQMSFQLRYRTQALRGLVVVRSDRARPLLLEVAGDPDSPLREVAARLLDRLPPD
jgi:hypothetical protein